MVVGLVALAIFALDVASPQDLQQWPMLLVGLAGLGLGVALIWDAPPEKKVAPPERPAAAPPAPKPAAPAPKPPAAAKPGLLGGLFGKRQPTGTGVKPAGGAPPAGKGAPPPKPAAPPPKKGLAGLLAPKPKKK